MSILYAILAVSLISVLSLSGIFALSLRESLLDKILFFLMSFSAGVILGSAFFDLLPGALEISEISFVFSYVAIGFVIFFFLERSVYWYHGHGHSHDANVGSVKSFVYLNLIGDGIHNLIDGMIITTSFLINFPLGIAATIAVFFHELPQEIGDFGILIFGGISKKNALLFNFLTSLISFVGIYLAVFLMEIDEFAGFIISLSAGGFIYLGASELLPEIKKEKKFDKSILQYVAFILGLLLMWSLDFLPF